MAYDCCAVWGGEEDGEGSGAGAEVVVDGEIAALAFFTAVETEALPCGLAPRFAVVVVTYVLLDTSAAVGAWIVSQKRDLESLVFKRETSQYLILGYRFRKVSATAGGMSAPLRRLMQ